MQKKPKIQVGESEGELISTAQNAVSHCNWVVGECAAKWTKKFAKGRTDADFGTLVGLSGDQVFQRRRVWEAFGGRADDFPALKWSHFYVSLTWENFDECLQWAQENESTVAEMKAWRRTVHGEDLAEESPFDEWGATTAVQYVPSEPTAGRDPDAFAGAASPSSGAGEARKGNGSGRNEPGLVAGVNRESEKPGEEYSPFRKGAASPAQSGDSPRAAVLPKPQPSSEQLAKRMCSTLERMNKALTPETVTQMKKLPEKVRVRLVAAMKDLSAKIAKL